MPIVAFNFDKISVEKKRDVTKGIKITNNIDLSNIKEENPKIEGSNSGALRISFEFLTKYEPKIASISLSGHIIYLEESKKIQEILNGWKKGKKINKDLMTYLINAVLIRCNIKALTLSQEVNLPPHIRLPIITPKKEPKDYIG